MKAVMNIPKVAEDRFGRPPALVPEGALESAGALNAHTAPDPRSAFSSRLTDYYELTKPRLNFLVIVTTMVGFYMASPVGVDWVLLLHVLVGTALTAASASVLNQLIEREHDAKMQRTSHRAIAAGRISPAEALRFGALLGLGGLAYLALLVNGLTALLGLATLLSYILIYTPLKRTTTLNTVIGAIPGAIPPMMGWTGATNTLSAEALSLFAILFLWQMPHFLAIAILYRDDYARGGFRMLPVVDPELRATVRMIVLYTVALIPASMLPGLLNMTGNAYVCAALLMGLVFLYFGVRLAISKSRADARKLFFCSIIYLPLLLAAMMMNPL